MNKFRTKKALLEYLGKKWNDNKLVDRMILRGEVIKEERMYILVDRDSEIIHLKSLVSEKEKEIKNLTDKIDELEYQLDGVNRSMWENYNEIIHRIYVYLKEVLHLNVRYDDLVEFIENYPSD